MKKTLISSFYQSFFYCLNKNIHYDNVKEDEIMGLEKIFYGVEQLLHIKLKVDGIKVERV
mgnify:CR=1 FL=1